MRPKIINMGVLVNDPNGISVTQKPAAGGTQNLTITGAQASGGVATNTNGIAQLVGINSDGNDSGRVFTVTGKDADGQPTTDTISTGPSSGTVYTAAYLQTVTAVTIDGNATGNLIVGWDVTASSGAVTNSVITDWRRSKMSIINDLTAGTMTYSGQYTASDPTVAYTNGFATDANWRDMDGMDSVQTDDQTNMNFPVRAVRLKQETVSATGACTFTVIQSENG